MKPSEKRFKGTMHALKEKIKENKLSFVVLLITVFIGLLSYILLICFRKEFSKPESSNPEGEYSTSILVSIPLCAVYLILCFLALKSEKLSPFFIIAWSVMFILYELAALSMMLNIMVQGDTGIEWYRSLISAYILTATIVSATAGFKLTRKKQSDDN